MVENQQTVAPRHFDDEIDLHELSLVLWLGKWLIFGVTIAVTAIAVFVALMLPNIYRAEALVSSNQDAGARGLAAVAGQYGGLASLAGLEFGNSHTDKLALGLEILESRKFISEFIERHNILVPLLATDGWDSKSGKLKIDRDKYDSTNSEWTRKVRPPRKSMPSPQEAYEAFRAILSVEQNQSGFVTIAIEHYSPDIAKQWVDWLIEDLNSTVMQQDVMEAEQAIEYLRKQIESTALAGLQNVFFGLIEEQTKTMMLARVSSEYLLRTVDPAFKPEKKAKPRRLAIVSLSALLGFLFSIAFVVLSTTIRRGNVR